MTDGFVGNSHDDAAYIQELEMRLDGLQRKLAKQNVGMTIERRRELESGSGSLAVEEILGGWHFCQEFDGLLTPGERLDDEGKCAFCGFSAAVYVAALREHIDEAKVLLAAWLLNGPDIESRTKKTNEWLDQ